MRLARLGADVLEIPTIRIVPVPLGVSERIKLASLPGLFNWLIFTSPNAVNYSSRNIFIWGSIFAPWGR